MAHVEILHKFPAQCVRGDRRSGASLSPRCASVGVRLVAVREVAHDFQANRRHSFRVQLCKNLNSLNIPVFSPSEA
uniref:Uncharacterized protein n=1 Tax=Romanomermis culicivorax TaxID=13658 RepID=A0A915IF52_ROMCU